MLFMSIQCNMSLLSRCIVSHPTRVNLSFKGNHFLLLLSARRLYLCARKKKLFPSPPSLFAIFRETFYRLWFSFATGRIYSPMIAENKKMFNIIAVNLIASLFDSQLNCQLMWPINANTRVSSLLWLQCLQWELQWELPKFLLVYRHKYFTMIWAEPLFRIYCLLQLRCPFLEFKYFQFKLIKKFFFLFC